MKRSYRSSIPANAMERVKMRHANDAKSVSHYFKNRKKVGVRFFDDDGSMSMEFGVKDGKEHGNHYEWISGKLVFFQKIRNGLAYGTAKQWSSETGKLIGSFKMNNGNGIDLWWHDWSGRVHLSEAIFLKNGRPHGIEWALNDNGKSVHLEQHWFNGTWHGIRRLWKNSQTLLKGFPQFYIKNEQVSKAKYLKACENDPTLPKYKTADDRWFRKFPKSLKPHLRRKKH
jgi:antitoxin component YwqK of YwqJK toxin-antitoxin module